MEQHHAHQHGDHPHAIKKAGHHDHGRHPHPQGDGHHHLLTGWEPWPDINPIPTPVPVPAYDDEIVPGQDIQTRLNQIGANKTVLISDGEYTHKVTKKLIPKVGQKVVLEATLDGALVVDKCFDARSGEIIGFGVYGSPVHRGKITGFTNNGVQVWRDTVVSNILIDLIKGTGVGGGFEGERETPVLVEFCAITRCGSPESTGHDAGGIKFARTGDLLWPVVRYNNISDIEGNGIWADVQACSMDVISNSIHGVGRKGIHWEKSGASDELGPYRQGRLFCVKNTVEGSGLEGRPHANDGSFVLVSSVHAYYQGNISIDARRGFDFIADQDGRWQVPHEQGENDPNHDEKHGWKLADIVVEADNQFASKKGCDLEGVNCR